MAVSGSPDAALVLRSGAIAKWSAGYRGKARRIYADGPGLARSPEGALASAELFVIINLPKRSTGTDVNVPLRGVERPAFKVRDQLKIVDGRAFEWGKNEVIVGVGRGPGDRGPGGWTHPAGRPSEWPVVGIFSVGGASAESEIWDRRLGTARRPTIEADSFQSVYARLSSPDAFDQFKDALTTDPRLNVKVIRQTDFLRRPVDDGDEAHHHAGLSHCVPDGGWRRVWRAQHDVQFGVGADP